MGGFEIRQPRDSGPKSNTEALIVKSSKDSRIELGHLHLAGEGDGLGSDVTAGIYLQAYDSTHYMSMDIDGPRAGWTLNRCPGPYEIMCASKTAGLPRLDNEGGVGFFLLAENGDIIIRAPKGRIRLSAMDIDLDAKGVNGSRGTINIESNQSVNINTTNLNVETKSGIKIKTATNLDIIANGTLTFAVRFMNGLTAASSASQSINSPGSTQIHRSSYPQ